MHSNIQLIYPFCFSQELIDGNAESAERQYNVFFHVIVYCPLTFSTFNCSRACSINLVGHFLSYIFLANHHFLGTAP